MLELTFNTNVRESIPMIREGEITSFIDHEGLRYLIDISLVHMGYVQFIPYCRKTKQPLGWREQYRFGMQNTWDDAILGPGPRGRKTPTVFPPYPKSVRTAPNQGQVIPDHL